MVVSAVIPTYRKPGCAGSVYVGTAVGQFGPEVRVNLKKHWQRRRGAV